MINPLASSSVALSDEALASQLRQPSGQSARETAASMNRANRETNRRAIEMLNLKAHDKVLEIGPGNGAFAAQIVAAAAHVSYIGLDWSHDMVLEAQRRNHRLSAIYPVMFQHGNSQHMHFADASFDKALAVHTVYFWDDPQTHLNELRRVLKPQGRLCLAFGDQAFMRELPFTRHGFALYDDELMSDLLDNHGWRVHKHQRHIETGLSNTGQMVQKTIHMMICQPCDAEHGRG